MYNPGHSLSASRLKLSEQTKSQNDTNFSKKRTVVDPLGIRVDTNLGKREQQPPQQIFPVPDHGAAKKCPSSKNNTSITLKPRRHAPPQPLNLQANPFDGSSSHGKLAFRPSPNESKTPIIIITPTNDETPKIQLQPRPGGLRRPRLTSSIYTIAPPWQNAISPPERSGAFSKATADQDGEIPPLPVGESFRNRDELRRTSIAGSILPTPNRSSGWWNVITSPFATRFSMGTSSKSSNNSDPTERTPLCDSAAPIAYGCDRGVDEDGEGGKSVDNSPDYGPFRQYPIPITGEASKYYDQRYDFSTPALLPAGFSTPDLPQSAQTARSDPGPFSPDDGEVPILLAGGAPPLQESSRKVPTPQMPCHTPPKSACAAVVENFAAMSTPAICSRAVATRTTPPEEVLSPISPSPVIETATVGRVQMARSVEAESARTPVPAFRLLSIDGTVNCVNDKGEFRSTDASKVEAVAESSSRPATSSSKTPFSDEAHATKERSFATANKSNKFSFRHFHTASRDSDHPLMSNQRQQNVAEYAYMPPIEKRSKAKRRFSWTKENVFLMGISAFLFIAALLSVVLCMTIAQDHSGIPVESHWLNLTGYPPLPTGISTVSQPKMLREVTGCVAPSEMWSCALPKGQQKPSGSGQPSFRLSILFNNQTVSNSSLTEPVVQRRGIETASPTAYARFLVRRTLLEARSAISAVMFSSLPAPPSSQDQAFLGRTTDAANYPYAGEVTPFFISFLPTTVPENLKRVKRSAGSSTPVSGPVSDIPLPAVNSDGTAMDAELYPFPEAQPLKLFNRGLSTEHYGFYSYFDKSIFLSSPGANASSNAADQSTITNKNGGAPERSANARCTWSQTRFIVQIWTKKIAALLPASPAAQGSNAHYMHGTNGTASAFDFSGPGSFPWPVTVSIDRHGGNAEAKGVYCYGVDANGIVATEEKAMHDEDRGYQGKLVNPAPHAFTAVDLSAHNNKYGGVDGGTGGCSCQWANWQ